MSWLNGRKNSWLIIAICFITAGLLLQPMSVEGEKRWVSIKSPDEDPVTITILPAITVMIILGNISGYLIGFSAKKQQRGKINVFNPTNQTI